MPSFLLSSQRIHHSKLWTVSRRRRRQRPGRLSPYDDDDDDDDEGFFSENDEDSEREESDFQDDVEITRKRPSRRQYDTFNDRIDPYADEFEDDEDDYFFSDEKEVGEEEYADESESYVSRPRKVEWEEVQVPNLRSSNSRWDFDGDYDGPSGSSTAYVLLPPSPPSMRPLPSAVLHFVGGTVFGSAPKAFYRSLLEDIVTHTQCAIVVTPLPVITPLNSRQNRGPLHHVQMAKNLQHQFQYAFENILEDEYGSEAMKSVPIAGLGHSLGSRILVVLATLMNSTEATTTASAADNNHAEKDADKNDSPKRRQSHRRRDSLTASSYNYKSMILISFTNFGADAGIPGVTSLLKQRNKIDEKNKQPRRRSSPSRRRKEPSRSSNRRRPRRGEEWYDDDDDEDLMEEWGDLWSEFWDVFQDQTDQVKTRLTPQVEDLEFYPTPRQLWSAVEGNAETGQAGRYQVPQTLLVQFDRDDMDQSAKLATALVASNSILEKAVIESAARVASNSTTGNSCALPENSTSTATATATAAATDIKFARLRGTHLTPVTTSSAKRFDDRTINGGYTNRNGLLQEWSSKSTKAVWNAIQGRVVGGKSQGGNMSQDEALLDLRQTITRYITDVVTK